MAKKPEVNPIQPVVVAGPIATYQAPPPPTWIEVKVLFPMERLAWKFLQGVIGMMIVMTILEAVGLLP